MLERFRKKSSRNNETTADVAAAFPEREVELEATAARSGNEIEQARQDLMRAAMESIAIPSPKDRTNHAPSVLLEPNNEDIPVVQVKVNRPKSPISTEPAKPHVPQQVTEPAAKTDSFAVSSREESPSLPIEPTAEVSKAPEPVKRETSEEPSQNMVRFRTAPLVTESVLPQTKETPCSDEPSIAQLDDIMIDIVKQDIASHRRRISPSK